jgi:hypothetical protein
VLIGRTEAQTTEVKTEYLMTLYAPAERFQIDDSLMVVNAKPGGWVKGPRISGKVIAPTADWLRITPSGTLRLF